MNAETKLQRAIKDALTGCGVWAVRIPRGVFRNRYGGYVHVAEDGFPDLLCLAPFGGIEIKVGKTPKPSKTQAGWAAKAARHGVRYAIVNSVRGALETVQRWRDEDEALISVRRTHG